MSRFIAFASNLVNVAHIVRIEQIREDLQRIYLDNGNTLEDEGPLWDLALRVTGHSHVMSISRCENIYAVLKQGGKRTERPVYYTAVCADGSVRPVNLLSDSVEFFDEMDAYLGLIDRTGPIEAAG